MEQHTVFSDDVNIETGSGRILAVQGADQLKKLSVGLLIWAVINIVLSGLSSPFGLLLVVLGAAIYWVRKPAMFIVTAGVFVVAALSNLIVGGMIGFIFVPIILVSVVALVRHYRQYRHAEFEPYGRLFPWVGLVIALLAPIGFGVIFVITVVLLMSGSLLGLESIAFGTLFFLLSLSGLVFGLGLASLLESIQPTVVAWLTMFLGLFGVLVQIGFTLFARQTAV